MSISYRISTAYAPGANLSGPAGETVGAMGVVSRVRPAEVAWLRLRLGMLPEREALPGIIALCRQTFRRLRRTVRADPARSEDEFVLRFATQLMREYLDSACHACHGRGQDYTAVPVVVCPVCRGAGVAPVLRGNGSARARAIGLSRNAYRATWAHVFDSILSEMHALTKKALGEVRQKRG